MDASDTFPTHRHEERAAREEVTQTLPFGRFAAVSYREASAVRAEPAASAVAPSPPTASAPWVLGAEAPRALCRGASRGAHMRGAVLPLSDGLALVAPALIAGPGWPSLSYVAAVLVALNASGQHRLRICKRSFDETPRIAASAALPLLLLLPWMDSAGRVALLGLLAVGCLVTARVAVYAVLRTAHRAGHLTEPTLIVGSSELGSELAELMRQHRQLGLEPVGVIGADPPVRQPSAGPSLPFLGDYSEIFGVVAQFSVRNLIVCCPERDAGLAAELRANCPPWMHIYVVPPMFELASAIPAGCMDDVRGIPLVPLQRPPWQSCSGVVKRGFDLTVGTALLIVVSPLLAGLMAAQLASFGRLLMFRQERVTRSGRLMQMLKFRTMTAADPDTRWTVPTEECRRLGRWLRATHLDELPQLFNVIRGDMSLVGPRPERPFFTSRFTAIIANYEGRHRTHAGITGWAQVHGLTGDTSISERVRFDNYYIDHWSLWLDVAILTRTLTEPLAGAIRVLRSRRRAGP